MTVSIRQATSTDVASIDQWEQELFGTDAWSRAVITDELSHPDSYYLVATEGDRLVGYAGLRAAYVEGGQGDIQTIAVVPGHRRQGLGRRLLRQLLDEATRRGVGEVFLEVRADNPGALELYLSEGFREITRRRRYYQPDDVDAVVMSRRMSENFPGGRLA